MVELLPQKQLHGAVSATLKLAGRLAIFTVHSVLSNRDSTWDLSQAGLKLYSAELGQVSCYWLGSQVCEQIPTRSDYTMHHNRCRKKISFLWQDRVLGCCQLVHHAVACVDVFSLSLFQGLFGAMGFWIKSYPQVHLASDLFFLKTSFCILGWGQLSTGLICVQNFGPVQILILRPIC